MINEVDTKDEYIDISKAMWPFLSFNTILAYSRQGSQTYLEERAGYYIYPQS